MQEAPILNQYFKPRLEGEPDLIVSARQALLNAGINQAGLAAFDNDPNILFAADKNSNVQRFKLNTWLDTQYLSSQRNVSEQRMMVLDSALPAAWLEAFVSYHIPQMQALGLPAVYQ